MYFPSSGPTKLRDKLSEVIAVLTETYSANTLAISALIPWLDKSHDSILLPLLSRSAAKMAHQPSVRRSL